MVDVELSLRDRILDAAKACCDRWGQAKVTVDDIAAEASCSRATIYRLFPGGKDTLYEALRTREILRFFSTLTERLSLSESYEQLVTHAIVEATRLLREDEHLQLALASEPGEVAAELTLSGLPRIFRLATDFLTPWLAPHIGPRRSAELAEWLARLVVSYFLVPSQHVDLADSESAERFVHDFVLPGFPPDPPSPER